MATIPSTGEIFEYEARVRGASGGYRWMFHREVSLRDTNGNIVRWYGAVIDISTRKAAAEKIRAQEMEFRQMLELAPQQVAVFGTGGERLYANRVAHRHQSLHLSM